MTLRHFNPAPPNCTSKTPRAERKKEEKVRNMLAQILQNAFASALMHRNPIPSQFLVCSKQAARPSYSIAHVDIVRYSYSFPSLLASSFPWTPSFPSSTLDESSVSELCRLSDRSNSRLRCVKDCSSESLYDIRLLLKGSSISSSSFSS